MYQTLNSKSVDTRIIENVARIVLNTFGSFGDVHPYLALAIELKRRGHRAVVATAEVYRNKIEEEGLPFFPVRPNVGELQQNPEMVRKLWHPTRGSQSLIRDYLIPAAEDSYHDLLPVCRNADLILTHFAAFAGPIVAAKLEVPWLSIVLQPSVFLSVNDPPALPNIPWLPALRPLGRLPVAAILAIGRKVTGRWALPLAKLRTKIGIGSSKAPTLFEFSRLGTLALFSRHFAPPQTDWPSQVQVTGFPFYDRRGLIGAAAQSQAIHEQEMAALEQFFADGKPPVLFTLGSSAVLEPGTFYRESAAAAKELGIRAILLVGITGTINDIEYSSPQIHVASYAPYSAVMPRCSAIVHQGGIGTTAQALRAGRPMIVVPWSHDQPDNAHRVIKLGLGRSIPRRAYRAARAKRELESLLNEVSYAARASQLGELIAAEDGIGTACDAVEAALRSA